MAKPTLNRDLQKDRAVESYARHGVLAIAAAGAGVSTDTLAQWAKDDPEFSERLTRAKLEKADLYLRELDVNRDPKQMRWWLATMLPQHFAAKQHLEVTGANGGPIQVQSLAAIVIADARTESAYDTVLGALARANSNGEPGGPAVGGKTKQPDPVAALPAPHRDRQGTPTGRKRRDAAADPVSPRTTR